jgi:phosphatidate cytidylyltransferase
VLRWRLSLGVLLIAALVGLSWLDVVASPPAGRALLPLALVVCCLASGELLAMLRARGFEPLASVVYGGNLLIVCSNIVPSFWRHLAPPAHELSYPLLALVMAFLCALAGEMQRYEKPGGVVVRLALATFALVYVGLLMSFLVQLRLVGGGNLGMGLLAALIVTVKLGDVGAYAVGRICGRHKLAPRISPGKTIEGAIGGLAFSCLGSWATFRWFVPWIAGPYSRGTPWGWLIFGLVVGAAGMLGDLAESMFKRDLGCKDSSTWMPGFGGVLDIIDSLLVAAPVAYVCWTAGIVG